MIDTFKSLLDWALRAGISGYDREERRRLSIVNLAGYLAALSSISYAVNFTIHDFQNLQPLIYGNLFSAAVTASVPIWHRYSSVLGAAIISLTVAFTLFYFVSMLGTDSGTHLNYIGGAAIAFAIFGLKHVRWIAMVGGICIVLNIAAEFMFSTGSLQTFIASEFMRQLYILSAVSIIFIVALVVWYAFTIAADAEARSEQLLLNIFPQRIADTLRYNPDMSIADRFDEATVMFADIVGFTEITNKLEPSDLVTLLNKVFSEFDALALKHGAEKIKTIGDEYMAVCGAPDPREDHALRCVALSLDLIAKAEELSQETGQQIQLRIGIATGPITAGVIGKTKFAYDVWANTVNVASRLQTSGGIGRVHISNATRIAIREAYELAKAPSRKLKGIVPEQTWFVKNQIH